MSRPDSKLAFSLLAGALLVASCALEERNQLRAGADASASLTLFDEARGRVVPVLLYGETSGDRRLALISHGYGGRNSAYSFIAGHLAARGYVVASVQHELPGDAELPTTGTPAVVRRPSWQQGARSLEFVARTLRARGLASGQPVLLVGHSHGGDTSVLLSATRPTFARAVFTLDNRRFPLPRTGTPRICSVRSSDQVADAGVLPNPDEIERYGMVIVTVAGLEHNSMGDAATDAQKQAMLAALDRCIG